MNRNDATATAEVPAPPQEGDYPPWPLALNFRAIKMTDEQFLQFCADNGDLRFEFTAKQELIVMPPSASRTGWREGQLYFQVESWSRNDGSGITFGPSAGFILPNGAIRAPDVCWGIKERWEEWEERLRAEGKEDTFAEFVPDFVIELRSPTDNLRTLQAKMSEYIENGVRLGWLIDPRQRRVYVYRPGQSAETLEDPETVTGETALPGFILNLQDIW